MTILRRATENQQSDWRPIPEGMYEFELLKPEVFYDEKYSKHQVRFPLSLLESERARVMTEHPLPSDAPEGTQQSWRVSYKCGLSLGFIDRLGNYRSTRLVDFLAPCFGHENQRKFRKWIEAGGGPPKPPDPDNPEQEIEAIAAWLEWWQGLQVLGAVSHSPRDGGGVWANFGGPLAIGSLPRDKRPEYQAFGRGKLAAMLAESRGAEPEPAPEPVAAAPQQRTYEEIFGQDDEAF